MLETFFSPGVSALLALLASVASAIAAARSVQIASSVRASQEDERHAKFIAEVTSLKTVAQVEAARVQKLANALLIEQGSLAVMTGGFGGARYKLLQSEYERLAARAKEIGDQVASVNLDWSALRDAGLAERVIKHQLLLSKVAELKALHDDAVTTLSRITEERRATLTESA